MLVGPGQLLVGGECAAAADDADVALGVVLGAWCPAADHGRGCGESVLALVGAQDDEGGAQAVLLGLELFEGAVGADVCLAQEALRRGPDVQRIIVPQASCCHS